MKITFKTIESEGFAGRSMFHPKAALHPSGRLHMAIQTIGGGDYYGPVEYSYSDDKGYTWKKPEYIEELRWLELQDSAAEYQGVCDTVVNYDPASDSMVFMGHTVYYKNNRFMDTFGNWSSEDADSSLCRRGCYTALRPDGSWTPRQVTNPDEFADHMMFMCGCGQRIVRNNGEWLVAFYGRKSLETPYCFVVVYRMKFNGEKFEFLEHGAPLELHNNRGLLEPQLVDFNGRVLLSLRAEDGHAYYSESADGINFAPIQAWKFDDGTDLETSSTQQHWLYTDDKLFLSYTRKNEENQHLVRYRAPLYIAEVNPSTMELIKSSEEIVFPIDGDSSVPDDVYFSGNFMPARLSSNEWIITDGQSSAKMRNIAKFKVAHITL